MKMESFTLFRQHLIMSGINVQQLHPFNRRNFTVLFVLGINSIFLTKQLDKSESFDEYADTFYRVCFTYSTSTIFLTIVIKSTQLFKFIDSLEKTIDRSKCGKIWRKKIQAKGNETKKINKIFVRSYCFVFFDVFSM